MYFNVLRYTRSGRLDHYKAWKADGFCLYTVGHDGAFHPEGWYGCNHRGQTPERESARAPVAAAFNAAAGLFSNGAWLLPVL